MAIVVMPQLGESVTEGTILQWMKQPGDPVKLDDSLCEIETEKVTAELPSPFEGTMGEIYVAEGETVEVGARLCEVAEAGVSAPARSTAPARESEEPAPSGNGWTGGPMAIPPEEREWTEPEPLQQGAAEPAQHVVTVPSEERGERAAASVRPAAPAGDRSAFYSPAVLRLARETGVDLAEVTGSGEGGRVTRKDVEAFAAGQGTQTRPESANPPVALPATVVASAGTPVTLSATRRTIANRMTKSNLEAPQAWTMVEADVTGVVRKREEERERFERQGMNLTLLPYMVRAVCEALREVPALNARWVGDQLLRFDQLNLAIAVAAESGLVVPVIHDAGSLSLEGLARAISDLAERARSRKLQMKDIEGGTFTVNNTGAFGSIASKPIVNHPEVGIVTFERAVQRPVVVNDAIAVRWMANLCLSFDHRALDGSEAGKFLAVLKAALEEV